MTVFLSYALSFILALIYGPYLFIAAHLWPAGGRNKDKKRPHHPSRFACFLLNRQNLALWSQLLFGLAIATACAVRRQDPGLTSYESTTMLSVTYINFSTNVITWSTIFRPVEHSRLFFVLVVVQVGLTYYLAGTPPARSSAQWAVLDECIIPIGRNLIKARTAMSVGLVVLQGMLLVAWGFLFRWSRSGRSCHPLVSLLVCARGC